MTNHSLTLDATAALAALDAVRELALDNPGLFVWLRPETLARLIGSGAIREPQAADILRRLDERCINPTGE